MTMLVCDLQTYRKARQISQGKLAKLVGVTTSYVSKIERGERDPGVELALRLSAAVDATVSQCWRLSSYD